MDAWTRLDQLATRQHGCVSREQLLRMGFSRRTVFDRARRQAWRELHPGVWALPGTRPTFEQQVSAALLAVGKPALVTGAAALSLRGIALREPREVALLTGADRHRDAPPGVQLLRARAFEALHPSTVRGLPLVDAERALADHARAVAAVPLGRLMARGCALRQCTLATLADELGRRDRWPGRRAFRESVRMLGGELTHSADERFARQRLRQRGIAVHSRPYAVHDGDRVIAEIDLAVPWRRYGGEVDGPHHDLPEVAAADKQRDRALRRLGWTVDRFPDRARHRASRAVRPRVRARPRALRVSPQRCVVRVGSPPPRATTQRAAGG